MIQRNLKDLYNNQTRFAVSLPIYIIHLIHVQQVLSELIGLLYLICAVYAVHLSRIIDLSNLSNLHHLFRPSLSHVLSIYIIWLIQSDLSTLCVPPNLPRLSN